MKTLVAVVLMAAAGSCPGGLKSEYVLTGTPRVPYSGAVRVVMDGTASQGTYTEVAIVTASGAGGDATLPAVLGQLQLQAAQLGCNAILRIRYDQGTSNSSATGVAVWLDEPQMQTQSPSRPDAG
jgi:hypothetical protein